MKKKIIAAVLALFVVVGAFRAFTAAQRIFILKLNGVEITAREVNGVHFDEIAVQDGTPKQLVIVQHGMGGTRSTMHQCGEALALSGYIAVCVDAYGYGENAGEETIIPESVVRTAGYYDAILEDYFNSGRVKENQFALVGVSLGGMAALEYGVTGKYEPACIAALYSSMNWADLLDSEKVYSTINHTKARKVKDEAVRAVIAEKILEYSPANHLETLLKTPILMINGGKDEIMPVPDLETLVSGMDSQQYIMPELVVKPDQHHGVGQGDPEAVVAFMQEHMP